MKKLFSLLVAALLVMSMVPVVFADGAGIGGDIDVDASDTNDAPLIFVDPTARVWNPNDQTFLTADYYGTQISTVAHPYGFAGGYGGEAGYDVPVRQNYMFTGETVTYFIAVYDANGEADIQNAQTQLLLDGVGVGGCAQIDETTLGGLVPSQDAYINAHFSIPTSVAYANVAGNDPNYKLFACTLIAQAAWTNERLVSVQTSDLAGPAVVSSWSDLIDFNPTLALTLTGGPISFGSVEPATTSISNTVYLRNAAEDGSGVVMDMYIASDDYFTDPINPGSICPTGNGIRYDRFSYYATKGSLDSGDNDDSEPGLSTLGTCIADPDDEFTQLVSDSGSIDDMCRIINNLEQASFLTQGSEMSLTFKLDVPNPCQGSFTSGQFQFVGRVV